MAAQANGPLRRDDKRIWESSDFVRAPWQAPAEAASNEPSFAQIKAQAAALFRPG